VSRRTGPLDPVAEVRAAYQRIARVDDPAIFLHLAPEADAIARAQTLAAEASHDKPLFGWVGAVKDNLDVAGMPTTAACPEFAYVADRSATVVERLEAAGAIVIGKTNLDQFATGLVGTRSPYGAPRNPLDPSLVPGGSSSGSAVAVARGIVRFALGTDTAGSGRVPAACTGIVGLKPSRGSLSVRGLVPAVEGIDCVSIFAATVEDAWQVFDAARGFDEADPWSRPIGTGPALAPAARVGVFPSARDYCSAPLRVAYDRARVALESLGVSVHEVDPEPFEVAGAMLYDGPWVAARLAAFGAFLRAHPAAVDATVATVVQRGETATAEDAHRARSILADLRRRTTHTFDAVDALLLPTVPTIPTLGEVAADPIGTNAALGRFTNFVNLLDLCAVALPVIDADRRPAGVTLIAPAGHDARVAMLAARLHTTLGASRHRGTESLDIAREHDDEVLLAVAGAHLRGQPLHRDLEALGATLDRPAHTSADYQLYALVGTDPPKPGLVRVPGAGAPIEVEVYRLDHHAFGRIVASVPPPLCIGTLTLDDGSDVRGFLCEPYAVARARDITAHGGWRAYLAAADAQVPA
jgi:allophanate hydrolase